MAQGRLMTDVREGSLEELVLQPALVAFPDRQNENPVMADAQMTQQLSCIIHEANI
jgi:hypothetical protein